MKTIKQISLIVGFSIIIMILMSSLLFIITGSVPVYEIMITYVIIDLFAIYKGWHKTVWKSMVEGKPLTEEEADFFK